LSNYFELNIKNTIIKRAILISEAFIGYKNQVKQ